MPTQGHSDTGHTRAYDSVRVVSCSARCRACVHSALSAGVCMRSVGTLFRARGIDATVGVQRSASTAPVPEGTPPRCFAHTPHAPALVPPIVDHLPCRGGVSLRSRSACAAQQGRPTPSSPEERTNCEGRKKTPQWDATSSRVGNSAFRPSRHPPQYQKVRAPCADHMALNKLGRPPGRQPGTSPQQTRSPEQVKLRQDLLRET